jgi:SSS family solute:Na+ symporter
MPLALVGWSTGVATIWSSLFLVGNLLYGRWRYAALLGGIFLISGFILIKVVNRLWEAKKVAPETT